MSSSLDYDSRSLHHERRMLEVYRKGVATDGGLLQPLANACWRAAAFEWQTHQDAETVRSLWEEAGRALTEGFSKKPMGFEQSAEQLLLALNFSIAAQSTDLAKRLVHVTPATTPASRQHRFGRIGLALAKGYQLVLRAMIEQRAEHARAAKHSLAEAHLSSNPDLRRPSITGEIDWRSEEQWVINALLNVIASVLDKKLTQRELMLAEHERVTMEFSSLMDCALVGLDQFVEAELDHRPKLYCWLPGVALTVLAASAGMQLDWLSQKKDELGYSRLPLTLIRRNASATL